MRRVLSIFAVLAFESAFALGLGDIAGRGRNEVEDGAPCCVTGVVTLAASWLQNSGVLAPVDDPNGRSLWFSGETHECEIIPIEGAERLEAGQVVEINGSVSRLAFAPGIIDCCIRVIGRTELPPAPEVRLYDLAHGVMDNRRVRLNGVFMNIRHDTTGGRNTRTNDRLEAATPFGNFLVRIPDRTERDWSKAIDAEISVTGVASSIFNIRGEFIGVQIEVNSEDDVEVVSPPPEEPEEAELGAILPYSPEMPDLHRRKVRGTVTYANGSLMFLQDGEDSLKVLAPCDGFSCGDEVEVLGFPQIEHGMGVLKYATVRKTGDGSLPPIVTMEGRDSFSRYYWRRDSSFERYDSRLVEIVGSFGSIVEEDDATTRFTFVAHDTWNEVVLDGSLPQELAEAAAIHPAIRIRGVMSFTQEEGLPVGRFPRIVNRRIFVSSTENIELIKDVRYLAHARGRWFSRAIAAVLVVLAVFAAHLALRNAKMRTANRRMTLLAEERKRMAADLHDTIEQNLVAANMMLKGALSPATEIPDRLRRSILDTADFLISTKKEIRETIFNLRNDDFLSRRPEDVIRDFAARISRRGIVNVRTSLRGLPESLGGALLSDLHFVAQEAVTNAVKHGRAKNVFIVSDPMPGGFVLRIANDGAPFDAATAPGPETGHYGLSGMEERARRSGFSFSKGMERNLFTIRLEVRV